MVAVLCAMVASTTFLQTVNSELAAGSQPSGEYSQHRAADVQTYRDAQRAIASSNWKLAATLLAKLVDAQNPHRLTHLCTMRLAECYVKLDEPDLAIQLLSTHLPQYSRSAKSNAESMQSFNRGYALLTELYQQLPNDEQSLAQIEAVLASSSHKTWPDHASALLYEQWRRQRNLRLWQAANESAQTLRSDAYAVSLSKTQLKHLEGFEQLGSRLVQLSELLAGGNLSEAQMIASKQSSSQKGGQSRFEFRFSFAELLIRNGYFQEGLEQFELLSSSFATPSDGQDRWIAPTELRIAELLVQTKRHHDALKRINQALATREVSDPLKAQLHFLAARCLVADVQFEPALKRLKQIQTSDLSGDELHAKSYWYEGEIHLLARNIEAAANAYRQALNIPSSYQIRSKLQLAQCWEQLGKYEEAHTAYSELQDSMEDDIRAIADQSVKRIAQIPEFQNPNSSKPNHLLRR